ncbi:MAG TPA: spherulation-specific family 4 protein [Nitrososphaerales archaeon]|nr:spherulation-specific family 4 protein [Nitrososphaerales archaeon]
MDVRRNNHRHIFLMVLGSGILIAIIIISGYSTGTPLSNTTVNVPSTSNSSSVSACSCTSRATSYTAISSIDSQTTSYTTTSSINSQTSTQNIAQQPRTGVIVPIFADYSESQLSQVNEVIQTKLAYPSVPMIAVMNPSGGPGISNNPNILAEVKNMQTANVTVLGYVPTIWGTRNITSVEADILTFHDWYQVNGTYLDQMPNWEYNGPQGQWYYPGPGGTYIPSYFSTLTNYAKSLGMTFVFGNSGADVPQNFIGTVTTIGIFENAFAPSFFGDPSLTGIGGWHLNQNKSNFAFFSYGLSSLNPYYVAGASDYVSYMFLTNGTFGDSYVVLPPYFNQMVSTLASMVSITVRSEILNGAQIGGSFATTVIQPDGTSSEGYTPFTFEVLPSSVVTISAESFAGYVFDHWSDGSTSPVMNVTVTQAMTLISYYRV